MTETDRAAVARAAAAALAARFASPKWTPLPHQVPPPGDWRGWALFAGRGAGKTDACANYITEHVNGPACLPGPSPHWIGIIGPTQGDAVTSCVNGPSGLKAHDPTARLVTTAGGTVVRWANGSEAKIFGAHSPEDVERLRSGGNRSIEVGTPIHTDRGLIPIEQVTTADRVWTRLGLRPVTGSWNHGMRPIWTLTTRSGRVLRLTPDHKVWTQRGWIRCDHLSPGDTLSSWNTAVTVGSDWARTGPGPSGLGTSTGRSFCTDRYTKTITGPYPRATRSTTRTTTSRTMTRPTLWPSLPGTITGSTESPRSGMQPVARCPDGSLYLTVPVSSAELSSTGTGRHGSVPVPAGGLTSWKQPPVCSHASCALAISRSGGSPLLSLAPDVVETISPGSDEGPVWDLTVAGEHEFFAGDLLVSNCVTWCEELAAWRYLQDSWDHMRFGLRAGPRPHWIASTTPKPKPLIIKLAAGLIRGVALTTGVTTYDNPHLPQHIRDDLEETYAGTQLGSQELLGRILEEDENALWTRATIEAARILPDDLPPLVKRTVGVDPSGGAGEQGIVVTAKSGLLLPGTFPQPEGAAFSRPLAHGFVLADETVHLSPEGWGRRAVQTAVEWDADDIVVEKNYGGAQARSTIRAAAERLGVDIPIREVWASVGKKVRAGPVSALSEQLRWHHAGVFPELETQLTTWHEELGWSPDRLDAMVWGPWHMKLVRAMGTGKGSIGTAAASQNIGGARGR